MSRAFPYRRPAGDVVTTTPWTRVVADGTVPLLAALEDWDYNTVLDLRRAVCVDVDRVRAEAGLPDDAGLTLAVRWTVTGSLLRGCATRVDVKSGEQHIDLACTLPGGELGGTLTLETLLLLATPVEAEPHRRVATRPGSVLWGDAYDTRLRGGAAMFPIATADFEGLGPWPDAPWYVELSGDLEAQVMGALLLIVNTRNETLMTALASPTDPRSAPVLSSLYSGVATTLVESAVTNTDFDPSTRYAAGTVGEALGNLVRQLGLAREWPSLADMRATQPALFAKVMQHATRLWAGAM